MYFPNAFHISLLPTISKHLNKKIPERIFIVEERGQRRVPDDAVTLFAEYHGKIT